MRLFVYGTLRHPGAKRFGLGEEQLVATGVRLKDYLIYRLGWFPGIQPIEDNLSSSAALGVVGDVFEVPDSAWGALDSYEGYPSLYRRERVEIEGIEGPIEAYVYNGAVNPDMLIKHGDWFNDRAA